MRTEYELVHFLQDGLKRSLGKQFLVTSEPEIITEVLPPSLKPDLFVTNISSGQRIAVEVKVLPPNANVPLTTVSSLSRMRDAMVHSYPNMTFVLVTPSHITKDLKEDLGEKHISVIEGKEEQSILERLVGFIEPPLVKP